MTENFAEFIAAKEKYEKRANEIKVLLAGLKIDPRPFWHSDYALQRSLEINWSATDQNSVEMRDFCDKNIRFPAKYLEMTDYDIMVDYQKESESLAMSRLQDAARHENQAFDANKIKEAERHEWAKANGYTRTG